MTESQQLTDIPQEAVEVAAKALSERFGMTHPLQRRDLLDGLGRRASVDEIATLVLTAAAPRLRQQWEEQRNQPTGDIPGIGSWWRSASSKASRNHQVAACYVNKYGVTMVRLRSDNGNQRALSVGFLRENYREIAAPEASCNDD